MKSVNLHDLAVTELVDRLAAIGVQQDKALVVDGVSTYTPLHWQMDAVKKELKGRPGDQRRALLKLFDYPNMQVRLAVAKAMLAVAHQRSHDT